MCTHSTLTGIVVSGLVACIPQIRLVMHARCVDTVLVHTLSIGHVGQPQMAWTGGERAGFAWRARLMCWVVVPGVKLACPLVIPILFFSFVYRATVRIEYVSEYTRDLRVCFFYSFLFFQIPGRSLGTGSPRVVV